MTRTRKFANDRRSVTSARRFATEILSGQPPETTDPVALMTTELASNCVLHTDSEFEISINLTANEVRIAATDAAPGRPTMRQADPAAISGRGLAIIDMLASEWGVEAAPTGKGKTVWFSLRLAPAPARSA